MKRIVCLICLLALASTPGLAQEPVFGRAPLQGCSYAELPLGQIHAQGWLQDQLLRMRDGMTGHLDEWYPEVLGPDNAWLGGEGDTWERGPYWLDGLLPLAYQLNDKDLIAKANRWVEAMLASVTEDGYFGNTVDHPGRPGVQTTMARDWWPRMVALKVLKQHYMATGDERVLALMEGYFRYQLAHLPETPLDHWSFWGRWRGGDNLDLVYWLYDKTGEPFLLELGEVLHAQTEDWMEHFTGPDAFLRPNTIHCVNLAHGFKEPVVHWRRTGDPTEREVPWNGLMRMQKTLGLATGLWAGDELIQWGDPVRGSEFCTAVEMMFSLEEMLRISGDGRWADQLERVAYNALPTQATDAFDARQYYQQSNQIACTRAWRNFSTPHDDTDVVFGLLNGYPCCTCNLHQGWPKFVQNLWYATEDGGLAALVYGPSVVETALPGGQRVRLDEQTSYPFGGSVRITVDLPGRKGRKKAQASFPLHLRIPGWCEGATVCVNGEPVQTPAAGEIVRLERTWSPGDVVSLALPMAVTTSTWFGGSTAVERGPLVYALKMDEHWEQKTYPEDRRAYGNTYYEVTSDTPWNYGLSRWTAARDPEAFTVAERDPGDAYPWNVDQAPVSIFAKAVTLPFWEAAGGSAGPVSYYLQFPSTQWEKRTVELIPYGCTTLRISQFPSLP